MSPKQMSRKKNTLAVLWVDQLGECWYCGRDTVIVENVPYPLPKGFKLPQDAATLEHIFPKGHPFRNCSITVDDTVMCCHKCNHKSNVAFMAMRNIAIEYETKLFNPGSRFL